MFLEVIWMWPPLTWVRAGTSLVWPVPRQCCEPARVGSQ